MKKGLLFLALFCVTELFAVDITVSKTISDIGTEYGWQNGQAYESFALNNRVTITATKPTSGNVNGYYWNDKMPVCWRLYQARGGGEFSVSVPSGYIIRSVALEYYATKAGVLSRIPGKNIPTDSQVASGQTLSINAQSVTLYAGNRKDSTVGQVSISKFTVCYSFADTLSIVETFAQVEQTQNNDVEKDWKGDIDEWKAMRVRRASKDTLNGGVQATWVNGRGYLQSTSLEGGIKRLHFAWREFVTSKAPIVLAVSADQNWSDTLRVTASGSYPTSKNMNYENDVLCKENAQLKFMNISHKDTIRLLLGDIYITPYIYFPKEYRIIPVQTSIGQYDLADVLMDNTEGEGEIVYSIVSDSTGGASIRGSVVDLTAITRSGDVVIKASWNSGKVSTTTTLSVSYFKAGEVWVETFSNCQRSQLKGTTYVFGDDEIYDWNITNFTRTETDTVAGVQGIQIRPGGSIATNGGQEGGLLNFTFQWRAVNPSLPIHFVLTINGKNYDYKYNASAVSGIMTCQKGISTSQNSSFSISVPNDATTPSAIVVGPVAVEPRILFTVPNRIDTVILADTTIYDLSQSILDNTFGSGTIVYSILSDETGEVRLSGSKINLGRVTRNGTILVQAQWGDVTTTMNIYALYSTTAIRSTPDTVHDTPYTKFLVNGELRIIRNGRCYSVLGN